MEGLTKLLPQVLRGVADCPEAREQCVFAAWVSVVGRNVSRVTAPLALNQKRLLVAVLDDAWRVQLKRISGQIAFKINAILGTAEVRAIDLAVNEKKVHAAHPAPARIAFSALYDYAGPLREKAELIPDPALRAAFLRVAGKCLERSAESNGQFTDGFRTDNRGR
jgi:hypothetical protein